MAIKNFTVRLPEYSKCEPGRCPDVSFSMTLSWYSINGDKTKFNNKFDDIWVAYTYNQLKDNIIVSLFTKDQ